MAIIHKNKTVINRHDADICASFVLYLAAGKLHGTFYLKCFNLLLGYDFKGQLRNMALFQN